MSQTATFSLPATLRRVLNRYRRRNRIVSLQRGLLLTLGATLAATGLAIAADRMLRLEPGWRLSALITIGVLLAAAIVWWVIVPLVARITTLDAAIRVGRHFPDMQEDLVTAVELTQADETGVSSGLVRRVLADVSKQAEGRVDYRRAVPLRPLLAAIGVFALVGGSMGTAYALRPEAISNALQRLFSPQANIPYFSYTQLSVEPGNHVMRMNDTLMIRLKVGGQIPASARLETVSGSKRDSWTITPHEGNWQWTSGGPLYEDMSYRVQAGDAVSPWYKVRVLPPPSLAARLISVIDPPYAESFEHAPAEIRDTPRLVVGSRFRLLGRPADRGQDDKLTCVGRLTCDSREIEFSADAEGLLTSSTLDMTEGSDKLQYQIDLVDGYGLRSVRPETLQVAGVADEKPRVRLTSPAPNLILLPGESFDVVASAEDEFGMRDLVLSWRRLSRNENGQFVPDEGWTEVKLTDGGPRQAELTGSQVMLLTAMGVEGGQVVEYRAVAADYAGDAFLRRGFSPVHRVVVMTYEEHMEKVIGELQQLELEIRRAALNQENIAKQGDAAADAASENDAAGASKKAGELANQERSEQMRAESIADRLKSLAREASRNSSMPARSLQGMANLAEAVRQVGKEEMKQAESKFGQAGKNQENDPQSGDPQSGDPQSGDPQSGQPGESQKAAKIRDAAAEARKAGERLKNLGNNAQSLRRQTILDKLAADAELLAQRQLEVKEATITVAAKTASMPRSQLPPELSAVLTVLAVAERSVQKGVEQLDAGIDDAARMLAFSEPEEALRARKAYSMLNDQKVLDKVTDIAIKMDENVLFSTLPRHDEVAASLREVAEALREEKHELDQVEKTIAEFIRRQKELNKSVESGIGRNIGKDQSQALGRLQATLAREVSEEASALNWLAMEMQGFRSLSVEKLSAASGEMNEGALDLFATSLPPALEHGRRALALLEEAAEAFKEEKPQMQQGEQQKVNMEIIIKLLRIITGQKEVNRETAKADEVRTENEPFRRLAGALAEKQSGLRVETQSLLELLAAAPPQIIEQIDKSAELMNISRLALSAADTGEDTRIVQKAALALLEDLLKGQGGGGGAGSSGGGGAAQMFGQDGGNTPGGNPGGSNAAIDPAELGSADDDWRRTRTRFEGEIPAGLEEKYPARYRELMESYFRALRKEQ